jgi:uncharacterized protein YjiS (DUF1127 family)
LVGLECISALQKNLFSPGRRIGISTPGTRATTAATRGATRRTRMPQGVCAMAGQAITAKDINALTGRSYPAIESGVPSLSGLVRRLARWYGQQRRYRETVSELDRLSDHVLADIGIGRHQIHEVARAISRKAA